MADEPYRAEVDFMGALATEEALACWAQITRDRGIVPVLCLAIGIDGPLRSLHMLPACSEMTDERVVKLLTDALRLISEGKSDHLDSEGMKI